jgi:YVTN family beta-propeller protein
LYIANAGSDTVSVVDVANDQLQVITTVLLRPSNVINLPGVSPSGLALSPDEQTLYVSLGDFNAVGVIDTGSNQQWKRFFSGVMISDGILSSAWKGQWMA